MRLSAVAGCVVFAGLISAGCNRGKFVAAATDDPKTVSISITCSADGVVATVTPSVVEVNFPNLVSWEVTSTSTVSDFSIDKKKDASKKWPYGGSLPYKAKKGEKAKSDGTVWHDADGRYGYSISANCTPADGPIKNIVIDPDMIIIRGGTRPQ